MSLATYASRALAGIFRRAPTRMVESSPLAISRFSVEIETQSQIRRLHEIGSASLNRSIGLTPSTHASS